MKMENAEFHPSNVYEYDAPEVLFAPVTARTMTYLTTTLLNTTTTTTTTTSGVSASSPLPLPSLPDSANTNLSSSSREHNYLALLALILLFGTAGGNILVCLAIAWERRLQNVTNYFLMSLAITDLMVAILVMPLGILILYKGYFPLNSEYCLIWICLDVLFCTASIMHLCTISVDRYLSLRYPMRFGRNKTRKRVILKIAFVWVLSVAMSLPLSLMYSKEHSSVLIEGTCQIPDPVYKLVGSIICFYIPLVVMLLTYCLTIRLLDRQRQNLYGVSGAVANACSSSLLGQSHGLERRSFCRRLFKNNHSSAGNHPHSGTSTDTELSTLDTHELWLPESSISRPEPITLSMGTAIHRLGADMLMLSQATEAASDHQLKPDREYSRELSLKSQIPRRSLRRASECTHESAWQISLKPKCASLPSRLEHSLCQFPPASHPLRITESSSDHKLFKTSPPAADPTSKVNAIITWNKQPTTSCLATTPRHAGAAKCRRTATFKSSLTPTKPGKSRMQLSIRHTVRPHHSRNSSVMARHSSRHGRIIRLEQKATKVLGVVFFTFVVLWAPFFILNLLPMLCPACEKSIASWAIDLVTWLGYGSSMVNPIFYTIFNNIFRQTFKSVLLCRYKER